MRKKAGTKKSGKYEPKGPNRFLVKLAEDLFANEDERATFMEAVQAGDAKDQAIILLQDRPEIRTFPRQFPTPWQPSWVYRIVNDFKPAKHPLYAKGAYYSLDFSSVFSAALLLAIKQPVESILDLCASPGGKSIFAWKAFAPEILMCNETIRKRANPLIDNLIRCDITNSMVWTADPSIFAKKFAHGFDLVLCDAPCSGQSLLAKGDAAPDCFSPAMIDMCVGRQRRITGNAVKCLKPGGHLLYSTCTYAIKENEKLVAWLLSQHPELEAVEVPGYEEYRSNRVDFPCYRLYPQNQLGAGAFAALLRWNGSELPAEGIFEDLPALWKHGAPHPAEKRRAEQARVEKEEADAAKKTATKAPRAKKTTGTSKPRPSKSKSGAPKKHVRRNSKGRR